ncbi:MAG: DUF4870 domain-containing protein [Pseudomonadota bacterium]|nr:DUF4870 domain-containing protein [Pseudomonadota bacterium]
MSSESPTPEKPSAVDDAHSLSEPSKSPDPSNEQQNWASIAHVCALSGLFFPFGQILGPAIVYLMKKDESEFIAKHAMEAVNFQITNTLFLFIASLLMLVLIGFVLFPLVLVFDAIFVIVAALAAQKAEHYRYPLTLRLFK